MIGLGYAPSLIPDFMTFKKYFLLISIALYLGLSLTLTVCNEDDPIPSMCVNGTASIVVNRSMSDEIIARSINTDRFFEITTGKEWLTDYKKGNKVDLSTKENLSLEDWTRSVVLPICHCPSLTMPMVVFLLLTDLMKLVNLTILQMLDSQSM